MSEKPLVLITGATGQVGSALVRHFRTAGFQVAALSRRPVSDSSTAMDTEGSLLSVAADLLEEGAADKVAADLAGRVLFPVALVNAARNAEFLAADEAGGVTRRNWADEFTLDVVAAYELGMALKSVPGSRLKSIVNVSSIYGMRAPKLFLYEKASFAPPIHYGVAKAALIQLTRDWAVRLAPEGIAVNAVSFGGVEGRSSGEFQRRYGAQTPAGRMLKDEELGPPVEFLARLPGPILTGQNLAVDGGWTLW